MDEIRREDIKNIHIYLIIVVFGIFFLGLYEYITLEPSVKIVKCYDNNNNEMIGEKCIEKITPGLDILDFSLSGAIFLVISYIFFLMIKIGDRRMDERIKQEAISKELKDES